MEELEIDYISFLKRNPGSRGRTAKGGQKTKRFQHARDVRRSFIAVGLIGLPTEST